MIKLIKAVLCGASAILASLAIATTSLKAGSDDFAGPYVAIHAAALGGELDGTHTDEDGAVTKGTGGSVFAIAGAEIGYNIPLSDTFFVSIGASYIDGSEEISKGDDSADNADVTITIADHLTVYLRPSISVTDSSSVYAKVGYSEAALTATGDVTGKPGDLEGATIALGTETLFPNGAFMRTEAGMTKYDEFKLTGIGGSSTATLKADPTTAYGAISLGYKF